MALREFAEGGHAKSLDFYPTPLQPEHLPPAAEFLNSGDLATQRRKARTWRPSQNREKMSRGHLLAWHL
jgi:hypothetical protein